MNSLEQRIIDEIEDESESLGRIQLDDVRADPDIIRKKVDEKIKSIMDKYGYMFALTEFSWINGQIQANIEIVEKPKE